MTCWDNDERIFKAFHLKGVTLQNSNLQNPVNLILNIKAEINNFLHVAAHSRGDRKLDFSSNCREGRKLCGMLMFIGQHKDVPARKVSPLLDLCWYFKCDNTKRSVKSNTSSMQHLFTLLALSTRANRVLFHSTPRPPPLPATQWQHNLVWTHDAVVPCHSFLAEADWAPWVQAWPGADELPFQACLHEVTSLTL